MKNRLASLALLPSRIHRQHVQFLLAVFALAALALGAGAPLDGGGSGF